MRVSASARPLSLLAAASGRPGCRLPTLVGSGDRPRVDVNRQMPGLRSFMDSQAAVPVHLSIRDLAPVAPRLPVGDNPSMRAQYRNQHARVRYPLRRSWSDVQPGRSNADCLSAEQDGLSGPRHGRCRVSTTGSLSIRLCSRSPTTRAAATGAACTRSTLLLDGTGHPCFAPMANRGPFPATRRSGA